MRARMPPGVLRSSPAPRTTRYTGEPSAFATRMPVRRCSSAVPQFFLKRTLVGQMLQPPAKRSIPRSAAFFRTSASAAFSSDSYESMSLMNSASHFSAAAWSRSCEAFQPIARTAKLSKPSLIFARGFTSSAERFGRTEAAARLARKWRRENISPQYRARACKVE